MKQHVTREQIAELTTVQFKRLPLPINEAQIAEFDRLKENGITSSVVSEYMTIGQMIEILQEKFITITHLETQDPTILYKWTVNFEEYGFGNVELCDCLWEAVKKVL